jgi:hypothetical protein
VETEKVRAYAARSDSDKWMTPEERRIRKTSRPRAHENHLHDIGWKPENMWSLAWILGFHLVPSIDGEMITQETGMAMYEFLPKTSESSKDLLAKARPRTEAKVLAMEDLSCCAHNAARSAQLGGKTVPPGFDPVVSGGVIHERRHALTWATTPGVPWDETDPST